MNDNEMLQYQQMCDASCQGINIIEKTNADQILFQFLSNRDNHIKIQAILLSNTQHLMSIVITLEQLNKIAISDKAFEYFFDAPANHQQSKNNMEQGENTDMADKNLLNSRMFVTILRFVMDKAALYNNNLIRKSSCNLLSQLIRVVWLEVSDQQNIVTNIFQPFFTGDLNLQINGLTFLDMTIQNVTSYSYQLGYLSFRRLMSTFQSVGLNFVVENIFTIFKQSLYNIIPANMQPIAQALQLNAHFQQLYTQPPNPALTNMVLFNAQLTLFYTTLMYNFNMSYFELDCEIDPCEHSVICFPQKWADLFQDAYFYQNLFNLFYQTYTVKNQKSQEMALLILRCLNRVVSCRMTIFDKELLPQFVKYSLQGICGVIKVINALNHDIFMEIIEFNIRMINNLGIKKIILYNANTYLNWLLSLKELICNIILQSPFEFAVEAQFSIHSKCFHLWKTLIKQVNEIVTEDAVQLACVKVYSIEICNIVYTKILNSNQAMLQDFEYSSFKKFRKGIKLNFEGLLDIFKSDYSQNIINLANFINQVEQNYIAFLQNAQNFLNNTPQQIQVIHDRFVVSIALLVSLMLNSARQDRSVHYYSYAFVARTREDFSSETDNEQARTIISNSFKVLDFENKYSHQQITYNQNVQLIYLFFLEQYLTVTLDEIDTESVETSREAISMRQNKVYSTPQYHQLLEIATAKLINNFKLKQKLILEYSISILKTSFVKLKRCMQRETFMKLPIVVQLSNNLLQMQNTALDFSQFYKIRTSVFELLTVVWLDDYQDNYLTAMEQLTQSIKNTNFPNGNLTREGIIRFFRDSMGLANHLDVSKIFKLYVKNTYADYYSLYSVHLDAYFGDEEVMHAAFDFMRSLITNRSQRLTLESSSSIGYQLFRDFSRFVIRYLNQYTPDVIKRLQTNINSQDTDRKLKLISKIWGIMNSFLKGKYLNFAVFQLFEDTCFIDYLKINLEFKFNFFEYVFIYPKMLDMYVENISIICESLLGIMFEFLNTNYITYLLEISFHILKKFTNEEFNYCEYKSINEDILLNKTVGILFALCQFCLEEYNLKYSFNTKDNIAGFVQANKATFKEMMSYMFEVGLKFNKNPRLILTLGKGLFGLVLMNSELLNEVKQKHLAIIPQNEQHKAVISKAYENLLNNVEQKFDTTNEDRFVKNYKALLKAMGAPDIVASAQDQQVQTQQSIVCDYMEFN